MCFASLPSSYYFYFFRRSNHALSAQFVKGEREREHICFKNFSECEIKQSFTWNESFTI